MTHQRVYALVAAISGGVSVMLGAFGTHTLRAMLSAQQLETFGTAVRYQLIHSVVILIVSQMRTGTASVWWRRSLPLFVAGIVCFSGSLYALVFTGIGVFGPITPLGGACLIAGWICLALSQWKQDSSTDTLHS